MIFVKQAILWIAIMLVFSPFGFVLLPFIAALVIIGAVFFELFGWTSKGLPKSK